MSLTHLNTMSAIQTLRRKSNGERDLNHFIPLPCSLFFRGPPGGSGGLRGGEREGIWCLEGEGGLRKLQ